MTSRRTPAATVVPFGLTLLVAAASSPPVAGAQEKEVAGWVEYVVLYPGGLRLRAKLDTGARTSSLGATDIDMFTHEGREWVRFRVTNAQGESVVIERPVLREAIIKRHFGRRQRRPVITLTLCIGDILEEAEVNLVDRSGFLYQMLVGRSMLKGDFLVDPGRTFRQKPRCEAPE